MIQPVYREKDFARFGLPDPPCAFVFVLLDGGIAGGATVLGTAVHLYTHVIHRPMQSEQSKVRLQGHAETGAKFYQVLWPERLFSGAIERFYVCPSSLTISSASDQRFPANCGLRCNQGSRRAPGSAT